MLDLHYFEHLSRFTIIIGQCRAKDETMQHVDKGKLNKCILKANVDTVFCLKQYVGHSNCWNSLLDRCNTSIVTSRG